MPYKMRIEASFGTQSKLRRMDNEGERKEIESTASFSGELSGEEGDASSDIVSSSDPEEMREDATSLRPFLGSPSSDHLQIGGGDPLEMSSLMSNLPLKRGLSRHYDGKSQSFRSLSNVMCLEDLVKPERPCKKQRLSSSAGWLQDIQNPLYLRTSSKSIKKVSRGSLCSPKTQK